MAPHFSKVLDPDTNWSDLPLSSPEGDWGPYFFKLHCIFIASPSTDNPLSSPASMPRQSFMRSEMPPLIFPSTTSPVTLPAAPPTPEHDTVLPPPHPSSFDPGNFSRRPQTL
ncbi:hypothetical protein L218DRAFT_1001180 [Marasmius fiardii PR-910]|nr:hypothetical protein L218DRAFT_1001180 [Marasmius fiardii PR-910]